MPANKESDITQAELEAMMENVENYLTDEEVEALIQELNGDVSKANPYRDEGGKFASSGTPGMLGGVAFKSRISPKAAAKGAKVEAKKKAAKKKEVAQRERQKRKIESKMTDRERALRQRMLSRGTPYFGAELKELKLTSPHYPDLPTPKVPRNWRDRQKKSAKKKKSR
jgi:hypothetical protein